MLKPAKTYKNWIVDDWSQVIFPDEFKFNLFDSDELSMCDLEKGRDLMKIDCKNCQEFTLRCSIRAALFIMELVKY